MPAASTLSQDLLRELGLTEEEYLLKQEEYLLQQQTQARQLKQQLALRCQQTQPGLTWPKTQQEFRACSQQFSALNQSLGLEIYHQVNLHPPLRIGGSPSDCYHQTHWINTCLLFLLWPEEQILQAPSGQVTNICQVEEDPLQRAENRQVCWHAILQAGVEQTVKPTQEDLQNPPTSQEQSSLTPAKELLELLQQLNQTLQQLNQTLLEGFNAFSNSSSRT